MYHRFFGLREAPFKMTPDPRFLFFTPQHREALAGITHAILTGKRLLMLTGEIGTGKTTLITAALQYLPPAHVRCCAVFCPTLTPLELLDSILRGLGATGSFSDKAARLARLHTLVDDIELEGKIPVLFIDEAHAMSPECLEEIRLWGNLSALQIILAGQPELARVLNQESLQSLKQRIALRLSIEPLLPEQIIKYIECRWTRAGGGASAPFAAEALQALAEFSGGLPRLVNALCDNALIEACLQQSSTVERVHILAAAAKLDIAATSNRSGDHREFAARSAT